jgi:hypothetical protein
LYAELNFFRWAILVIAFIVSIISVVAICLHAVNLDERPRLAKISSSSYRISSRLGKGELIFTPPALVSIIGFYQAVPIQQLWLLFLWSLIVFIKPIQLCLQIIEDFNIIEGKAQQGEIVG